MDAEMPQNPREVRRRRKFRANKLEARAIMKAKKATFQEAKPQAAGQAS